MLLLDLIRQGAKEWRCLLWHSWKRCGCPTCEPDVYYPPPYWFTKCERCHCNGPKIYRDAAAKAQCDEDWAAAYGRRGK